MPPATRHRQDARRRGSHEHTSFTFLGYGFRGRRVRTRSGRITTGFVPAISKDALNKISSEVRSWRLHIQTGLSEADLARRNQPDRAGLGELLRCLELYSKPQLSEKKNNPRAASYASR